MASQLPTSTSLLTSPTNFQGIPISQLLAALYGDTTTPSSQYAQPVMHSSSASFRKGVDPRNRPKAGGESEAARGSRLIRERRARQAARAEAEKTKAEAAKNTGTIMRTIGGMTGGTVGTKPAPANDTGNIIRTVGGTNEYGGPNISVTTKPAPAREGGFPPLADQVSNRRDLLIPQGPVGDRSYDAAEAARLGARTMGPPSSVYRAPEAAPVSRMFDDPTLRPEVAAAYARIADDPNAPTVGYAGLDNVSNAFAAGEDWARKYALGDVDLLKEGLAERRGEFGPSQYPRGSIPEEGSFGNAVYRVRWKDKVEKMQPLVDEIESADAEFRKAQRRVAESEARLNALRDAERAQEIEAIRNLPTGLFGNWTLPSDLYNALKFKPMYVR